MKKIIILLILFSAIELSAQRVRIYVVENNDKDVTANLAFLTGHMKLVKNFPCADYMSSSGMADMISLDRTRSLLDPGSQSHLSDFAGALGARYLVVLTDIVSPAGITIICKCMDSKTAKTLISRTYKAKDGHDALINRYPEIAEDFVKAMAALEICPFKGPLNFKITETKNEKTKDAHAVFCDNEMKSYKLTTVTNITDEQAWDLRKISKQGAEGNISWSLNSSVEETEENQCYPCSSGRTAGRTSVKTTTVKNDIKGLSDKSSKFVENAKDARIEIEFKDDGTYFLKIKAASAVGTSTTKITETVEGSCDAKGKNETHQSKRDIALEKILGPFPGKPTDKILSDKGSRLISESSEGRTIEEWDFTLTKE